MRNSKARKLVLLVLSLAAFASFPPMITAAGSLDPKAPPGPVMKSLDEVEPRIPIHASDLPLTITTPGSYYLAQDLNFTDPNRNAISVECNNVTIDLMGYNISGPSTGTNYGIVLNSVRSNVEIRNGSVKNFTYGIYAQSCNCRNLRVVDVRAVANRLTGISLGGGGHLVRNCTANNNGASASSYVYGINTGSGAVTIGNVACENGEYASGTVMGICAGLDSTVTGNMVRGNGTGASGTAVYGIYASSGCIINDNAAGNNGVSSTATNVYGIYAGGGCVVSENAVYSNGMSATGTVCGIYLWGDCLVDRNNAYSNNGTNISSCPSCTFGLNHAP